MYSVRNRSHAQTHGTHTALARNGWNVRLDLKPFRSWWENLNSPRKWAGKKKDDASLKRLRVCASNTQSPWLWRSAHLTLQDWRLTCVETKAQSAEVLCEDLVGGSLQLLLTCFIKGPKCEFLPTTTHCTSDLEIKDLPPSSLVGGLIFRWAVIENGRERRTMAMTFHYKGTACASRASLQTTWKPLWSNIPEGLLRALTLMRLPSHRNYLHEGRILERFSTVYKTNIWQKGEGEEGGGLNVTQIQKW